MSYAGVELAPARSNNKSETLNAFISERHFERKSLLSVYGRIDIYWIQGVQKLYPYICMYVCMYVNLYLFIYIYMLVRQKCQLFIQIPNKNKNQKIKVIK